MVQIKYKTRYDDYHNILVGVIISNKIDQIILMVNDDEQQIKINPKNIISLTEVKPIKK